MSAGRLIAFEGVDGAGKTTALHRVAERLRQQGVQVFLPRMGKEHVSRPTRMIRELTRDPRNLELSAHAELLLYCAREAQVLRELVTPALARGETVLLDRTLLTPIVLGLSRGLSREECEGAARLASGGVTPDLTLVFDVHPRTSRLRKRIERIRTRTLGQGGRKGLAGSAFKERVRNAYTSLAVEHGFPIFHVERATPDELAERVTRVVLHGAHVGTGETELDAVPRWMVPPSTAFLTALEALPLGEALYFADGLIAARGLRERALVSEPELAAYTLDAEDPLRERAMERAPDYALQGWSGRPLSGANDLRLAWLERAPAAALGALRYVSDPAADALREEQVNAQPDAVLASLSSRDDAFAWRLRDQAWEAASAEARASSLVGCASARAWRLRDALFEKNPVLGLGSLRATRGPRADEKLARYAPHAPKVVIGAIAGRTDAFAHELRETLFETGREVIDSIRKLDDDASHALRERALARWPSTVLHSLLGLPDSARVRSLHARCRDAGAGDLHTARRMLLLDEQPRAPHWSRQARFEPAAEGAA